MLKRGSMDWNLNSILQLLSLATMLFVGGVAWQSTKSDIVAVNQWIANQEQFNKDRVIYTKEIVSRTDDRFKSIESDIRTVTSIAENLSVRVTVGEQTNNSLLQAVKEVQSTQAAFGGDLKVVREILQRLEATNKHSR